MTGDCPVGAPADSGPAPDGARPTTPKLVLGCATLPSGRRYRLVGYGLGGAASLCLEVVDLPHGTGGGGCGPAFGTRGIAVGGSSWARGRGLRVEGPAAPATANVVVSHSRGRSRAAVIVPPAEVLARIGVRRRIAHWVAELPRGARELRAVARDEHGRVLGVSRRSTPTGPPEIDPLPRRPAVRAPDRQWAMLLFGSDDPAGGRVQCFSLVRSGSREPVGGVGCMPASRLARDLRRRGVLVWGAGDRGHVLGFVPTDARRVTVRVRGGPTVTAQLGPPVELEGSRHRARTFLASLARRAAGPSLVRVTATVELADGSERSTRTRVRRR